MTVVSGDRPAAARSSYRLVSSTSRSIRSLAARVPAPRLRTTRPLVDRYWNAARTAGAGQAKPLGELHLVVQPRADLERARPDRRLEVLGMLEVQRHRAGPVDRDHARGGHAAPACPGSASGGTCRPPRSPPSRTPAAPGRPARKPRPPSAPLRRPSESVNELGPRAGRSLGEESHGLVPRGHPDIRAVGATK
jgi:hypothetical protein